MPVIINGSTGISGTDGSAGTPAVQGTDTNTGMFFPAADQIAFAEGGVEAMRLDASGNVGIGTSSPGARLNVQRTGVGTETAVLISRTVVNLNDEQNITWRANDLGTDYAAIAGVATGATAGALTFKTISSGTTPVERARITSTGDFQFNSGYGSVATAFGCRAWVNFNGTGTVAIRASGNVSSITDNGTGNFNVNLTNAMPDANYNILATGFSANSSILIVGGQIHVSPTTSSSFRIRFNNGSALNSDTTTGDTDPTVASATIFR